MAIIIYSVLCVIYFILGCISITNFKYKDTAIKMFIALTVLLPITKFTTEFHTKIQISAYFLFFFAPCLIIILRLLNNRIGKFFALSSILLLSMLFFYVIQLGFIDEIRKPNNILKDLKPFILILLAIVAMDVYKERLTNILTRRFSNQLLAVNLIFLTIFFILMIKTNLHLKLSSDPYYKYEELRLETLGCYYGIFYFMSLLFSNTRIKWYEYIICLVPLIYTGNRTLMFLVAVLVSLYFLSKLSAKKILIFMLSISMSAFGLIYLIFSADTNSPLSRFQKLFSWEYINYALLNRFSPFIIAIKDFSIMDFIIGKGLGFTFFIPWFHYRKNLDDYNIYIDNLYLTLYAKYGVFFVVFYLVIYLFLRNYTNKLAANLYFAFILILTITNAFLYQENFLWIFLMMVFPFSISKQNYSTLFGIKSVTK